VIDCSEKYSFEITKSIFAKYREDFEPGVALCVANCSDPSDIEISSAEVLEWSLENRFEFVDMKEIAQCGIY
jgi:hypothetical protein